MRILSSLTGMAAATDACFSGLWAGVLHIWCWLCCLLVRNPTVSSQLHIEHMYETHPVKHVHSSPEQGPAFATPAAATSLTRLIYSW
jgi:hypothetical protein